MKKNSDEGKVMLTGQDDVEEWRFWLKAKASSKNVWTIITGEEIPPAVGNMSNAARSFRSRSASASELIVTSVSQTLYSHIWEFDDKPAAMFKRLIQVTSAGGIDGIGDWWDKFNELHMDPDDETALDYTGRFRKLRGKLIKLKEPVSDSLSISTLLKGLPDTERWDNFRGSIKRDIQGDDLDFVVAEILKEYYRVEGKIKAKEGGKEGGGAGAFVTIVKSGGKGPKGKGQTDNSKVIKRPNLICRLCGGRGHFQSECATELLAGLALGDDGEIEKENVAV